LSASGLGESGEKMEQLSDALLARVVEQRSEPERVQIFGAGHRERLSKQWGIEHTFSIPLLDQIAANGDAGLPFVLGNPDSPQAAIYKDLAQAVVSEVAKAKFAGSQRPDIRYNEEEHQMEVDGEVLAPADLRRGCRCAACVEELTGRQLLVSGSISADSIHSGRSTGREGRERTCHCLISHPNHSRLSVRRAFLLCLLVANRRTYRVLARGDPGVGASLTVNLVGGGRHKPPTATR
jgi:hypothetical protein